MFEARTVLAATHLTVRAPAGAQVWADSQRLVQVLSNLVGNAVRFTPNGGEIAIEAERRGPALIFSVRDTGPGISSTELPHLFDRKWQSGREHSEGLGLGLYIAKTLVELHGGRIWAESELGRGSTFSF